ncbi:DNA cytosine methyltransferase [Novosphingobium capsulatum]|uniref:DNA cytosine methyltransferase n=1 Tax=Novosphingobium capsulatum TaxID=13688 RepID=UPI0035B548F0
MGKPLNVLDLFSGIGGFSLGLERAKLPGAHYDGFETVAFCEIEEFPRRVLAKHWPEVPCYHDVRELTGERLAADGIAVDVICGGFPCQDISIAGKAEGLDGERSGLFFEVIRLVREIGPGHVVLENVTELLGRGLGDVLRALAEIGYDAEWHCIPAGNLGAPHERDRWWLVAYPNGERCGEYYGPALAIPTLLAGHSNHLGFAGWETPREQVAQALCRVDDGLRGRLDKLGFQALGNAVVPQIPELIGNAILSALADGQQRSAA